MAWRILSYLNAAGIATAGVAVAYSVLAPPLADWRASTWRADADHISADVDVLRLKDCHYVDGDTVGQVHEGGRWRRTNITVDYKAPIAPALGLTNMGRWDWQKITSGDVVDSVAANATFLCEGSQVQVSVGPFDVGK